MVLQLFQTWLDIFICLSFGHNPIYRLPTHSSAEKYRCFSYYLPKNYLPLSKWDFDHWFAVKWHDVKTAYVPPSLELFINKYIHFSNFRFTIYLKRKPLFYLVNVILPCMMLGFMQLLTFLTPPEAGEKISLSITILLSFTVFVLMISEMMPTTSISVPLLGKNLQNKQLWLEICIRHLFLDIQISCLVSW